MIPVRHIILLTIAALTGLLIALGINLERQLEALSTDNSDNMAWTFLQAESEVSYLGRVLAQARIDDDITEDYVRLRTDIAISRVSLVTEGRFPVLVAGQPQSREVLAQFEDIAAELAEILDNNPKLTEEHIERLFDIAIRARPIARRIAVLGNQQATLTEQAHREKIQRDLALTGGVALFVIASMSGLLMVLQGLLRRARERDAQLSESADRLASTVAASLDGIMIADADGRIQDFNASAEAIFGWMRPEVLGKHVQDLILFEDVWPNVEIQDPTRPLMSLVDRGRREVNGARKTGETFPVEINVSETRLRGEKLFISYIRDISQRKITERELIDARDAAQQADRTKSQFLSVMSHEMRTPLNGLLGVLDVLRRTRLTSRQRHHVDVASASGELLLEHVNEALDITRIEAGVLAISQQPFNFCEALNRVYSVLLPLASEKNLSLELECQKDLDMNFLGDPGRLGQIVTNLIGNAIKFTPEGEVRLQATAIHGADHSLITVCVKDTGPGIPQDYREKIFEDFVVLNESVGRQARGDGLGLPIARKIARLMGGDLTVRSVEGEGSTFTLTVPLQRGGPTTSVAEADLPQTHMTRRDSILVVEDNAINRLVLKEMLLGLNKEVTEATNGQEALRIASERKFDLIIMDISMPHLDGIETTRRLRRDLGPNADTFILGLTAYGREEYRAQAEDAGMDEFETKPIRFDTLSRFLEGVQSRQVRSDTKSTVIDREIADELREVLGQERFDGTVSALFSDLDTGLEWFTALEHSEDDFNQAAERAHKLRGGASMMGLVGLVEALDLIRRSAESANSADFTRGLDVLRSRTQQARDQMQAYQELRPEPNEAT